jgi:tetratricopeptide (TPR) repeat protein
MPDASTFELVLLGYRNDLARERTVAYLRRWPAQLGGPVDIHRESGLPKVLLTDIGHDLGLRLLTELSERGAQARLTGCDDLESDTGSPADSRARTAARLLNAVRVVLLPLVVACAAFVLVRSFDVRRLAVAPGPAPSGPVDVGRSNLPLRQHRLNDEAVELNAGGEFPTAAEHLRKAMARSPGEEVLRANLITVLRNWAVAEINAGRPKNAQPLLGEALSIDQHPDVLGLLGIAQEHAGEMHAAAETLERAVQLGTADPMAFVALGNVYRHRGDRRGAVEMFQRAREIGAAGADFELMLQRLERELDAEWDFVELNTAHFSISFAQAENQAAARVVSSVLEDAYFAVGRKLDLFPAQSTEVVLYASEDFHAVTQTPDWTGGLYDGRIKLPVRGLETESELLIRTVRHEYGHVLVSHMSLGRVPVWLNEGVALWSEEGVDGERLPWAYDTIEGQTLFRLDELVPPFTRLPAELVQVAYAQSYLAVQRIIDDFGERRLRELIRATGTGKSLSAAFEEALSVRLADFESSLLLELTS